MKNLLFFLLFFVVSVNVTASAPPASSVETTVSHQISKKEIRKKLRKTLRKQPKQRKNGGYQILAYLFTAMIFAAIGLTGLIVSLIAVWPLGYWIFGGMFILSAIAFFGIVLIA